MASDYANNNLVIGCVAENNPKYLAQALRLLQSVRWFGGKIADAKFLVCVVDGIDPAYRNEFEQYSADVRIVERFSDKHPQSNKLRFLEQPDVSDYKSALLLDCDTIVVQDPSSCLQTEVFRAKFADGPTVPCQVFEQLYDFFRLNLPGNNYKCTVRGTPTIPYFNAGVLLFSQSAMFHFVPEWIKLNKELIEHLELLGDSTNFCEQASLSLAVTTVGIPFDLFDNDMNFPTHHKDYIVLLENIDPFLIHYHNLVDSYGYLKPSLYALANKRIIQFNERLGEERERQRANDISVATPFMGVPSEEREQGGALKLGTYDIGEDNLQLVLKDSNRPELLQRLVSLSRNNFGFFTKTLTRSVEYPFIIDNVGEIRNKTIFDVGAGVSPLPLYLAKEGARVVTVDNSSTIRILEEIDQEWNEWGFLDYQCISSNITSINTDVLSVALAEESFDIIYSVSVVEHVPAIDRRKIWDRLRRLLKKQGILLLTLDLIPGTDNLWNYAAGMLVEDIKQHGNLRLALDELASSGFTLDYTNFLRAYRDSRTDVALLKLIRNE